MAARGLVGGHPAAAAGVAASPSTGIQALTAASERRRAIPLPTAPLPLGHPALLQTNALPSAPALVVAGSDNLEGLHDAFEWALQKMAKPGAGGVCGACGACGCGEVLGPGPGAALVLRAGRPGSQLAWLKPQPGAHCTAAHLTTPPV